jgi:hypothetical protein
MLQVFDDKEKVINQMMGDIKDKVSSLLFESQIQQICSTFYHDENLDR